MYTFSAEVKQKDTQPCFSSDTLNKNKCAFHVQFSAMSFVCWCFLVVVVVVVGSGDFVKIK